MENEYGYCGSDSDYIRHLLATAKAALGDDVIFYTTDPPSLIQAGSLPGDELYTLAPIPSSLSFQAHSFSWHSIDHDLSICK